MEEILWINGKKYSTSQCSPNTRLSDFLRDHAKLKGTKTTCREGGCGSCVVTLTRTDHVTGKQRTSTINSCLCPVHTLTDGHVTTVEGLGSRRDGFHPIQKSVAAFNGSQCGYCTPGVVMNMYGLLCTKRHLTVSDVEQSFDGNLCRCTGYRAILDSAKDFVYKQEQGQPIIDIEDLHKFHCVDVRQTQGDEIPRREFNGRTWYTPRCLPEVYALFEKHRGQAVRLVLGNTSSALENTPPYDVYISVEHVQELNFVKVGDNGLEIGGNGTIQELITVLENPEDVHGIEAGEFPTGLQYMGLSLVPYLKKLGNMAIRNAGSCAGNLMVKHKNRLFPSDLFTPMEALQAQIKIGHNTGVVTLTPVEFLDLDMSERVIISLTFPTLDPLTERFRAVKVMPRASNAYAYVNAGFYIQREATGSSCNIVKSRLAFGGMSGDFHRASQTEALLANRNISRDTLQAAYECVEGEIQCDENQVLPSGDYRRQVARNLLHLFLTSACDCSLSSDKFYHLNQKEAPVTSASYQFERNEDQFPYCEPMPKLDSCLQASGEAEFIGDKPQCDNEVHAVCVLSLYARADLVEINTAEAQNIPGVNAIITAKNMMCVNNITPGKGHPVQVLLAENQVEYSGQPVAIVIADTVPIARMAAKLVKVHYTNIQKPILSLVDAIAESSFHPKHPVFKSDVTQGDAEAAYTDCEHQISGEASVDTQYHFYMENLIAYCLPYDDMMDIWLSTQSLTFAQRAIAEVLDLPHASINVKALRLGGAFGGKVYNAVFVGCICALAARTVNRPVRCALSLSDCMKMLGKRFPVTAKYKVGFSSSGKIQAILMDYYHDGGYLATDFGAGLQTRAATILDNAYCVPHWKISSHLMKTNRYLTSAMRGPDQIPSAFIMESVMDHVASMLRTDPIILKENHLLKEGDPSLKGCVYKDVTVGEMWNQLKLDMNIEQRQRTIETFNQSNKYKKRGLCMTPSKYILTYGNTMSYNAYVTVYSGDGTIAITHGGIEMGQGLNTKVVQVAAKSLGVPIEQIKVHTTATLTAADSPGTFASQGSESVCRSVLECCNQLKDRMKATKETNPDASWKQLVKLCYQAGIEMTTAHKHVGTNSQGPFAYCIYGVCAVEAEVDVLTGENVINSVDAIYDIGESANPTIDIGQIDGSLVMGFGYFRTEQEIHDKETGVLLTDGTWEYKVPTAQDIPVKMNIKLLKNSKNKLGVMPSKAIGEPAILGTPAVTFAIKRAIASCREENGNHRFSPAKQPMKIDTIQEMCDVRIKDLVLDFLT